MSVNGRMCEATVSNSPATIWRRKRDGRGHMDGTGTLGSHFADGGRPKNVPIVLFNK